jgi:hypothetical protein
MLRRNLLPLLVAPLLSGATQQHPLHAESYQSEGYEFKWPINNVAIIGAGVRSVMGHLEGCV